MDLHFHVNHSGDAARVNGDSPILRQWPTSGGLHEFKPDSSLDRLIWDFFSPGMQKTEWNLGLGQ